MDLEIAAARLALAMLSSEQAIAAASAALDRGVYSDSLGLLMYQEPIWSEVGLLFKRALCELGIPIPARESTAGFWLERLPAGSSMVKSPLM